VTVSGSDIVPGVDLIIEGTAFDEGATVEILNSKGSVVATANPVQVDGSGRIRASFLPSSSLESGLFVWRYFPFLGNDPGPLSVRVTNRDGSVGNLASAIDLLPSTSGAVSDARTHTVILSTLQTDLVLPSVLYPRGVTTLTVVYENTGVLPMPA